jgi:hypothetical protein
VVCPVLFPPPLVVLQAPSLLLQEVPPAQLHLSLKVVVLPWQLLELVLSVLPLWVSLPTWHKERRRIYDVDEAMARCMMRCERSFFPDWASFNHKAMAFYFCCQRGDSG